MPLNFGIQPSSPVPAYRQVILGVRNAILNEALKKGERMPSIRSLAQKLAINPNTVARAYRELEHLNIISSKRGSGFEVTAGSRSAETVEKKLQAALKEAVLYLGAKKTMALAKRAAQAAAPQPQSARKKQRKQKTSPIKARST